MYMIFRVIADELFGKIKYTMSVKTGSRRQGLNSNI